MSKKIQAIRGMNDTLPQQTFNLRWLEQQLTDTMLRYGYEEIRFPIIENTALFTRSIGEITDIVEKEMYTFTDLNGDSLSLRPEGTASCVRACLQHSLLHNQTQKLWYMGPMFRHERPQKGRYRQFNQFGVECFGIEGTAIELELLLMCQTFWRLLGLQDTVKLEINSLGTLDERSEHRKALIDYFKSHYQLLDEDSQRRLEKNPLRILDSKNTQMANLIAAAPKLSDYFQSHSAQLFQQLSSGLTELGIDYEVNPRLVRGLDYYGNTVFEWTTDLLGAQSTVCAGGRYDGLVEQIGGRATPAVGFAMGIERLALLIDALDGYKPQRPIKLGFITQGPQSVLKALALADDIRQAISDCEITTNCKQASFKSQFKLADKNSTDIAIIIGDDEMANNRVGLKWLKLDKEQTTVDMNELIPRIEAELRTL